MPFKDELREDRKALKVQEATPSGRELVKKKWDDQLYCMAQDVCITDTLRLNLAVHRLAVIIVRL